MINWENDGYELKNYKKSVLRNKQYTFKSGITWTLLSSSFFGARYSASNSMFDTNGKTVFPREELTFYLLALMLSKVTDKILRVFNPTMAYQVGDIGRIPVVINMEKKNKVDEISEECVQLSKDDWDSFETSWDFKRHPLI